MQMKEMLISSRQLGLSHVPTSGLGDWIRCYLLFVNRIRCNRNVLPLRLGNVSWFENALGNGVVHLMDQLGDTSRTYWWVSPVPRKVHLLSMKINCVKLRLFLKILQKMLGKSPDCRQVEAARFWNCGCGTCGSTASPSPVLWPTVSSDLMTSNFALWPL